MKHLITLALALSLLTGCASSLDPKGSVPPQDTITKYNGEWENYFIKCSEPKPYSWSGTVGGDKIPMFGSYKTIGYDFENNIILDDTTYSKIDEGSAEQISYKEYKTPSYNNPDYYLIQGTAKILKSQNPKNCVIISNNLMRNIYDSRIAQDQLYGVWACDFDGDEFDDILVFPTYDKPQYKVNLCKLYDGKTLEEIKFLDKNLFFPERDKAQLIAYLNTNPSQLAAWFKNEIQLSDEAYSGNVLMEPKFFNIDEETYIALHFQNSYKCLGELYVVYGYKEEGMTLKYILLNPDERANALEDNEDD